MKQSEQPPTRATRTQVLPIHERVSPTSARAEPAWRSNNLHLDCCHSWRPGRWSPPCTSGVRRKGAVTQHPEQQRFVPHLLRS